MQRVLITGGAGFIGSHLAEALIAQGKEVIVIDDLSTGSRANLAALENRTGFQFVEGNILDARKLDPLVARVDFVYHLAATVGVKLVIRNAAQTLHNNVAGTENVLKTAARHNVGVLLTSSSEVYGKSEQPQFSEDDDLVIGPPIFPRWSYACSKLLGEFLALAYAREKSIPVFIVRLFNTVGPRQTGRHGMVLPRFARQAVCGKPITIYGDGQQTRCFCHVRDTVRALLDLPRHPQAQAQVFNVGSTEEIRIVELAQMVNAAAGGRSQLRFVPYTDAYHEGFQDMRRRKPDISKIRNLIGWSPTIPLAEIVAEAVRENAVAFRKSLK